MMHTTFFGQARPRSTHSSGMPFGFHEQVDRYLAMPISADPPMPMGPCGTAHSPGKCVADLGRVTDGEGTVRPVCRGGLAPGRWPGCGHAARAGAGGGGGGGGGGQAADLPVAHAVEDQGEQPPGGSDLGDILGLLAAAGDDGVPGGADHAVAGGCARWPRSAPGSAPAIPAW